MMAMMLSGLAAGVLRDESMGQVALTELAAVLGPLDAVLLYQEPTVAAVQQGADELVADVRVVGQGHLRGREPLHAASGPRGRRSPRSGAARRERAAGSPVRAWRARPRGPRVRPTTPRDAGRWDHR